MFKQLTQSENLVFNALLSMFLAALLGMIAAGIQYVEQGHITFVTLITIMGTAFCAIFGKLLADYVPKNIKTIMQAKDDLLAQKDAIIAAQHNQINVLTPLVQSPAPVVVPAPQVTVTVPPSAIVTPARASEATAPTNVQEQVNTPVQPVALPDAIQEQFEGPAQPLPQTPIGATPHPEIQVDAVDELHFPVSQQIPAVAIDQMNTTKTPNVSP